MKKSFPSPAAAAAADSSTNEQRQERALQDKEQQLLKERERLRSDISDLEMKCRNLRRILSSLVSKSKSANCLNAKNNNNNNRATED